MDTYKLHDVLERIPFPADEHSMEALALGLSVQFLQGRWGGKHVAHHLDRMFVLIKAKQFAFYFDQSGRSVGFTAWGLLKPAVSRALIEIGPSAVSAVQWNGGCDLWILDFFAHDGSLPAVLADLRDTTLREHNVVTYFRYKGAQRIAKRFTRDDQTSFFQRPSLSGNTGVKRALSAKDSVLHSCAERFSKAQLVGTCLLAMRAIDPAMKSALWQSSYRLSEIIALRQYRTYSAPNRAPAGLITWAWLSTRTISRIADHPLHDLHSAEWNEGEVLCLCDVIIAESVRKEMEADIFKDLFPMESTLLLYIPPQKGAPASMTKVARQQQRGVIRRWLCDTHGAAQ